MAKDQDKKAAQRSRRKKPARRTAGGISRYLFATNLILDAAAKQSEHSLTRDETLLLSTFKTESEHPHLIEQVDREFRKLLVVRAENPAATKARTEAVSGLVDKGLLDRVNQDTAVQLTPLGQSELKRISEVMDSVWDRLTEDLSEADRESLRELILRINP
jgi:hypothetical protein